MNKIEFFKPEFEGVVCGVCGNGVDISWEHCLHCWADETSSDWTQEQKEIMKEWLG